MTNITYDNLIRRFLIHDHVAGDIINLTTTLDSRYLKLTGSIAEVTDHSHTVLTDIGTNTHAQIDTFIGTTVPGTYLKLDQTTPQTTVGTFTFPTIKLGGSLTTGLVKHTTTTGVLSIIPDNSTNWDTAYGWGNHASAGYLTTSLASSTYAKIDQTTPNTLLGTWTLPILHTPTINGGILANDDITIQGTTHATRTTSYVILQPSGGNVGIGTTSPSALLHGIKTTEQLRLGYDTSNYYSTTVSSTGLVTLDAVGTGAKFQFNDTISAPIAFTNTTGVKNAIITSLTITASSGADTNIHNAFDLSMLTAGTQDISQVRGLSGVAYHTGSGTLTTAYGFLFYGGCFSTGNITNLNCAQVGLYGPGAGTIGTVIGLNVQSMGAYNTPTTMYGIFLAANTNSVGTSKYGLFIQNVSGAATNNYSIYTGTGSVHFGDTVDLASGKNLTLLAGNITTDTTTGTKMGTATTQKLGFWNVTPVVQPTHIADPTGGVVIDAEARTAIASINAMCATLGLTAAS